MSAPDVVIVCQRGARVDSAVRYGALRATIEMARALGALGRAVTLVGVASRPDGLADGIPFVGAESEADIHRVLRRLGRPRALIGCSRVDVFATAPADVRVVYHHGPHLPEGDFALALIRRLHIRVAVVSEHSLQRQRGWGVPAELLRLVRNGYDQRVFALPEVELRSAHRLVFAGMGVPYKGLDIAIAAFRLLRERVADAELHVFGSSDEWSDVEGRAPAPAEFLPARWRTADGSLAWARIVGDTPGLAYHGPVSAAELAAALQRASILVMPSRIEETFGLVSVEAQACGCLPVLPARGGFPETMRPGMTGYTYEPNTPAELARQIGGLWDSGLPEREQRVSAARWVAREFSWTRAARQFAGILDEPSVPQRRSARASASFWRIAARGKSRLRELRDRARSSHSEAR